MWTTTVQKTVLEPDGAEVTYSFAASGETEEQSVLYARLYASMVEYGLTAQKWAPAELPFPRMQLLQFIQPDTLEMLEAMYPDCVASAYQNAYAYVHSYCGNMFDLDAMLGANDTTSTSLTLRLALCICTVMYILASSPQYSDTYESHRDQVHFLLRGLKSGQRNFGKGGIIVEPNVRVQVVDLTRTGSRA